MIGKKSKKNLKTRQYEKRGLFIETWSRLRTNPGAIFGLAVLAIIILMMLYSIIFVEYKDIIRFSTNRYNPPSAEHIFGTDEMGRDVFKRVMFGARYSLAVAFGAVMFGTIIGASLGAIATYYGGAMEELVMRASDVLSSIPPLLLGMVIVSILGNSLINVMIAVGTSVIPVSIRMTRAAVISVKGQEFIESAHAVGMSNIRIVFTQILPNSLSPIIVMLTMRMAIAIIDASSLSFLGFGIQPPTPEWGAMVSTGRIYIRTSPYLAIIPGLFIMITTFACALLGDGLRDALDPKLKK